MKVILNMLGALLVLLGAFWFLQGIRRYLAAPSVIPLFTRSPRFASHGSPGFTAIVVEVYSAPGPSHDSS
jgi:hypothetical protein